MKRIGRQLIADKKAAILAQSNSDKQGPERKDMRDRDLLSLLIKANMAVDIAEDQRLTDDEVLARESLYYFTLRTLIDMPYIQRCQRAYHCLLQLSTISTDFRQFHCGWS